MVPNIAKYIQKHLHSRLPQDKGARLVSYSKDAGKIKANGFAWNSPRSWLWRKRLAQLAARAGFTTPQDFKQAHGSHWAWTLQKKILSEELTQYPTSAIAQADGHHHLPNDLVDIKITSSPKTFDYWEDHLDQMIDTINKDLSLARLRRARQPFGQ